MFHNIKIYGSRRTRVKERAARWLFKMRKLLKRVLTRWRNHTVDVLTKNALVMARFLPLKRK